MLLPLLLALAGAAPEARCLVEAYPDHLCGADATHLIWCDGTRMPWIQRTAPAANFDAWLDSADLRDQMSQRYPVGAWTPPPPANHDPGRLRSEAFFRKMYGDTARAVEKQTAIISWMGTRSRVTTVNGVDRKLAAVAADLRRLAPTHRKFFETSAGTFVWRTIKGTERLSMHSFAIAIDVGVKFADYWKWTRPDANGRYRWRNRFPMAVVQVFEAHGFIWGGKWDHFDTMHFEYRPELLHPACAAR